MQDCGNSIANALGSVQHCTLYDFIPEICHIKFCFNVSGVNKKYIAHPLESCLLHSAIELLDPLGADLIIKYQFTSTGNPIVEKVTILRPSYLYNVISYIVKMTSLY